MKFTHTKKLIKQSESYYVCLPKPILKGKSDVVDVHYDSSRPNEIIIRLKK